MESSSALTLFPKKPARDAKATGKALKLYSNYFQIAFDQQEGTGPAEATNEKNRCPTAPASASDR